jgi:MFS superfamily sulfate permease-like transporter
MVDVAGARMLVALNENVAKREIQLRIVGAHAKVRDLLRAEGLEERVGYLGRHISMDQAIEEFKHPSGIRDAEEGSSA